MTAPTLDPHRRELHAVPFVRITAAPEPWIARAWLWVRGRQYPILTPVWLRGGHAKVNT